MRFKGIKKACSDTRSNCLSNGYGSIIQINCDLKNGEVWTDFHCSDNEWTRYNNKNIVSIYTKFPLTMAEIRDALENAIVEKNAVEALYGEGE